MHVDSLNSRRLFLAVMECDQYPARRVEGLGSFTVWVWGWRGLYVTRVEGVDRMEGGGRASHPQQGGQKKTNMNVCKKVAIASLCTM